MRTARGPWLLAVAVGTLALALAFALAALGGGERPIVSWLAIIGSSTAMAGALAAGAIRRGLLSRWAILAVAVVFFVPLVGLGAAFLMPVEPPGGALWLGLPPRAALVLYGVGLLPVFILPACYALDFERSEDD